MTTMKDFFRQALWLSVCTVPIPAGAYAVHTPDALAMTFLSFTALAILIPFFFFSVQKSGYGSEWGKKRCGVHLITAASVLSLFWMILWFGIGQEERFWKAAGTVAGTILGTVALVIVMAAILRLDYVFLALYKRLRKKGTFLSRWGALVFFTGCLPGFVLSGLLFFGLTRLDGGMVFVLFVSAGMAWVLYLKIALAMASIAFYLYFSLEQTKLLRAVQVVFTAFFWLLFLYIPMVVSLQLPLTGGWRVYADPAYLSIAPFLSDLWLAGAALWVGEKVTAWIGAAGEK